MMPVTHLLLLFPSRSESVHLFSVLKVFALKVNSPKAAIYHGFFALLSLRRRVFRYVIKSKRKKITIQSISRQYLTG